MDIIKTGIGLSKTIKNVSRFREIINVFWRNGFDEFIIKTNLHSKVPNFVLPKKKINVDIAQNASFWTSLGYRLRLSFEELGVGFIKFGQLLATREDLLHPDLIRELKKLQNNVKKINFDLAQKHIAKELNGKIEDIFISIDPEPIGVASIGVAYKATLLTKESVVLKLKRPNIEHTLQSDFEIIAFLVQQAEKVSRDLRFLGVSRAIDDFFKSIQLELNFLIEARNCEKLSKNISLIDKDNIFKIPKIYQDYTTSNLLVMEYLDGKAFNQIDKVDEYENLEDKLAKAVNMFTHTILSDGFFHADLHGGNFLLQKDGKIGLIDFGLMGSLSKRNRNNLVAILFALFNNNYQNLVYEFLDVADYDVLPDPEHLQRDIRDALDPYLGLSVSNLDVTQLVHSIVTTLSKHQVYLPREWFIIFRSLMTLDGVGKSLGIDINIFEVLDGQIEDVMKGLVSKETLIEDSVWVARDTLTSLSTIPRHLKWILKDFSKKKYTFDVKLTGVQKDIKSISQGLYFFGLILMSSTFLFSGVYLVKDVRLEFINDIPVIVWIMWIGATLCLFRASIFIKSN